MEQLILFQISYSTADCVQQRIQNHIVQQIAYSNVHNIIQYNRLRIATSTTSYSTTGCVQQRIQHHIVQEIAYSNVCNIIQYNRLRIATYTTSYSTRDCVQQRMQYHILQQIAYSNVYNIEFKTMHYTILSSLCRSIFRKQVLSN